MPEKLSASDIVCMAITWAEESMVQMVDGCSESEPYRAEIMDRLKQMRAYRNRRFGRPKDPFEGAKLVDVLSIKPAAEDGGIST